MKLIAVLILLSFLQSTILGVDLILVVLIARSLTVEDKENYFFAFGLGLLISYLTGQPLGLYSLVYLLLVKVVYLVKLISVGNHYLMILPIVLILSSLTQFIQNMFFSAAFTFSPVIAQTLLAIPIYLAVKFWEERFIPKKEIKLRLGR